ncbi:MAG: response regulator [Treponema sp.]|jgi:PleD family two-component response regulator|nr:response regulator [Treponema sp.]
MDKKWVVLAVDDNVQQLNEFKTFLVPQYDLRVVKSAAEAISFLYKNDADIILLDIEMPNISGFEFLADIRKVPSHIDTPIIIITGNSGSELEGKAKKASVYDIFYKPITPELLINTIEKALAGKTKSS